MPTKIKVSAVKKVIEGKESVTSIAKELGIARKTVYSWLKTYKNAASRNKKTCLAPKYSKGRVHPKEYKHTLEKGLLRLIKKEPALSVAAIAKKLNAGQSRRLQSFKGFKFEYRGFQARILQYLCPPGYF